MYKNLKALRQSLHMTQKEFAASLGITYTTYNGYETGARDPKSDFWIAVATKYGVTIDYLMGYSDDPHRVTSRSIPVSVLKLSEIVKEYRQTQDQEKLVHDIVKLDNADRESLLQLALKIIYAVQQGDAIAANDAGTPPGGPRATPAPQEDKDTVHAQDGLETPPEGE